MYDQFLAACRSLTPAQKKALYTLATAIVAVLIAFGVVPSSGNGPAITETTVTGPSGATTITAETADVEQAQAENTHEGEAFSSSSCGGVQHDTIPSTSDRPCVPMAELAAARKQQLGFAAKDNLPTTIPLAAPSQRGCRTRMVGNKSSRNGVNPRLLVPHYTVSPNRPGFQDVDSITSLFDRLSFMASSSYVIDRDGNCNYIVRESEKPWTQATFNPVSISWEIINTGSERPLFTNAGLAKMAMVMSDAAYRWDIPIRKAKVSGCTVKRSGIIDHRGLGACGGGHGDIGPWTVDHIIDAILKHRAATRATINYPKVRNFGPKKRKWCKRLAIIRKNARADEWTEKRKIVAERYKSLIGVKTAEKCRFA